MHFVAGRLGVPSVQHVRGPLSPRNIAKYRVGRSSAVIPIAARYEADLLAAGVAAARIREIDDAVDLGQFHPEARGWEEVRRRFDGEGRVLVGLIGRVERRKRVLEFLEAAAPLAGTKARFLIVGQPSRPEYLREVQEAVERLGLSEQAILTGRCGEVPALLSALDVVVTMSGGSVMFEAQACGRAVLSVRTDGRHSVHTRDGETAVCVTTDRPGPATEALGRLIEDEALRRRIGQAARTWALEHLSPELMVARTQAVYEELLGA